MGIKNMMVMNLIGCSIFAMAFMISTSEAGTMYHVGDSFGWNTPTNETFFSDWASNKTFYVGDGLVFNWTGTHTVADVSKAKYDNCTTVTSSFGSNANPTTFQLNLLSPGPRYFICTIDNHCINGQKFSINVNESPSSAAHAPSQSFGILTSFFSALAVYSLTHN